MRVEIIKIGNSRGVRLPKAVLEQCGFVHEAELSVEAGEVRLKPLPLARQGWEEAFREGALEPSETMLGEFDNEFEARDWEW